MSQLYPIAGTTTSSCASQDFDFLNYWVDQTVEKEILRGKKLQELKQRPSVRKEKYDVIKIENPNVFFDKNRSNRRSKSPIKSRKKGRRNSPYRKNSPTRRIVSKKDSKSSRQRCPLRIAELAVPSKRQCIDTWRNKHHVLPGFMIARLRQHVLDLSPVVKIPDAIECFKKHTYLNRRKSKSAKENKSKRKNNHDNYSDDKIKKKTTKSQNCRYLCAIFGHKIAKELNKPLRITLNTELEYISDIVSTEIEKLVNKGKNFNDSNVGNKRINAEIAGKVSIWIANILEETAYKILEDQLSDFEEEVGPVLDLIDNLVDKVVDVCEPVLEVIEVSSSSDTSNIESSTEYNFEEDISQIGEIKEQNESKQDEDDNISVEVDFPEQFEGNLDDFIKNELENIINGFDGDNPTEAKDTDFTEIQDQSEQNKIPETEVTDNEPNEFVDANDFNLPIKGSENNADTEILEDSSEVKESIPITDQEQYADKSIEPENDAVNHKLSEDDSIKKVKFSDINMVTNEGTTEHQDAFLEKTSTFINPNQIFSAPNDHLLSDADESWPEDISPPILRPSESVSKSITSLGNIMESEEIISIILDDTTKVKEILNDMTADAKQLNETNEIITNSNNIIKHLDDNTGKLGGAANEGTANIKEVYEENEINTDKNTEIKEQIIEKERNEQTHENIVKDAENILEDLKIAEDGRRSSTESTFDHVLTETVPYEHNLDNILEEQATQIAVKLYEIFEKGETEVAAEDDKILEDKPTQEPKVTEAKKGEIQTVDKEINTSFSLVPREDKSTSVISQSLGDISKRFRAIKADDIFSSLRKKPKVDYKVHKNSAPSWVTRNFGEPSDSFDGSQKNQKKGSNDKNIRLWCKDLENGFYNLELWNDWIENTLESVKILERKKARICIDKAREEFVRDWLHLKKNLDSDVLTWIKRSKSTQEKLKGFRKIYQNFKI